MGPFEPEGPTADGGAGADDVVDPLLALVEAADHPPTMMEVLLPETAAPPSIEEALDRLQDHGPALADWPEVLEVDVPGTEWVVDLAVLRTAPDGLALGVPDADPDEPLRVRLTLERVTDLKRVHLEWKGMTAEDVDRALASEWAFTVTALLGTDPLRDFHRLLRVADAVGPDAVALLDLAACWPHPGPWLRERARTEVPPAPEDVYGIHAVYDAEHEGGPVWLHTHGLHRCGIIELEMVDVPRARSSLLGRLLNVACAQFLEYGVPEAGSAFEVGAGLTLAWLPWQEAPRLGPREALGPAADRDADHEGARGLLVVPPTGLRRLLGKRWRSPAVHLEILEGDPLLFVSTYETERRAALARELWPRFAALLRKHRGRDRWRFCVKLGYPMGHAEDGEREHLWFDVHHLLDADRMEAPVPIPAQGCVEATLLNQPRAVRGLREGERGTHSLSRMSDWTIFCEHGQFEPSTFHHLERLLDDEGADGRAATDPGPGPDDEGG